MTRDGCVTVEKMMTMTTSDVTRRRRAMVLTRTVGRQRRVRPTHAILALVCAACVVASGRRSVREASSFIDANGVRRRAPPAPSASAWLDTFGLSSLTTSSSTREASAEEVDGACEACEATRDVVRATARRRRARGVELACGSGKYLRALRDEGFDVMGVEPRIGNARDGAAGLLAEGVVAAAPLRTLPFKRAFFDYVLAFEVFGKMRTKTTKENVDPVVNEATRVAKYGARMVFATRRTLDGRGVGGGDDFKSRRWWMDTFCAHGWVEDTDAFLSLVKSKDGTSSKTGPRNWFVLKRVRKIKKRGKCTCAVPPGKDAENFCGGEGRPKARDEVKAFWKSLRERSSAAA